MVAKLYLNESVFFFFFKEGHLEKPPKKIHRKVKWLLLLRHGKFIRVIAILFFSSSQCLSFIL